MKKEKADHLIRRLGIREMMERIVNDHEGYQKFENVLSNILSSTTEIRLKFDSKRDNPRQWLYSSQKMVRNPYKSIDYFRRFYGINQESETQDEISRKEGVTRGYVNVNIDYVLQFIKQKHRREIIISSI
jgi:hypothetical protein